MKIKINNNHTQLTALLDKYEDGLTIAEAMKKLKIGYNNLMKLLEIHKLYLKPIIIKENKTPIPNVYSGNEYDYIIVR